MKKILFSIGAFILIPLSAFAAGDLQGHSFPISTVNEVWTQTGTSEGYPFYVNTTGNKQLCFYPANPFWVVENNTGTCDFYSNSRITLHDRNLRNLLPLSYSEKCL